MFKSEDVFLLNPVLGGIIIIMNSETLKSLRPSSWANLQYIGLIAAGVPAINMTLLHGGKYTEQIERVSVPKSEPVEILPFNGLVPLNIHQGGLRMREIPSDKCELSEKYSAQLLVRAKKLFREDVMPILLEIFPGIDTKYSGTIELGYREGLLTNFNLT